MNCASGSVYTGVTLSYRSSNPSISQGKNVVVKIGVHLRSYKVVLEYRLHRLHSYWYAQISTSRSNLSFVSEKFALEAIVQIVRSLWTKSMDINQILSLRGLSIAFSYTDLKPLSNYFQHVKNQSCGVTTCNVFFWNWLKLRKNHFSWKRIGEVFPKAPDGIENVRVTWGGSNRI